MSISHVLLEVTYDIFAYICIFVPLSPHRVNSDKYIVGVE